MKLFSLLTSEWDWVTNPSADNALSEITNEATSIGQGIYGLVRLFGILIVVIVGILLGVGFATAKNANERAEKKTHFVWYVVGVVMFFGIFAIISYASKIGTNLEAAAKAVTGTP